MIYCLQFIKRKTITITLSLEITNTPEIKICKHSMKYTEINTGSSFNSEQQLPLGWKEANINWDNTNKPLRATRMETKHCMWRHLVPWYKMYRIRDDLVRPKSNLKCWQYRCKSKHQSNH